jgi:hypothetical protein
MPNRLQAAALALLIAWPGAGLAAERQLPRVCRGLATATFEQRFPTQVRHFDFDREMVEPFVRIWRAGRRPALPALPERVRVYALPKRPYLVGFQRDGCVIALLTVERRSLWRWLRPRLGWPA